MTLPKHIIHILWYCGTLKYSQAGDFMDPFEVGHTVPPGTAFILYVWLSVSMCLSVNNMIMKETTCYSITMTLWNLDELAGLGWGHLQTDAPINHSKESINLLSHITAILMNSSQAVEAHPGELTYRPQLSIYRNIATFCLLMWCVCGREGGSGWLAQHEDW